MNASIDFLAENLLSTLDSQRSDLLTQRFAGLDGLLFSFNLGGSNDLVAFFGGLGLGLLHDGLCAALGIRQACGILIARLGQLVFHALVSSGKL